MTAAWRCLAAGGDNWRHPSQRAVRGDCQPRIVSVQRSGAAGTTSGDTPLTAAFDGMGTQSGVVIAVQD
jgi:hypothetical protein